MERHFDLIYYSLCAIIGIAAGYSTIVGLKLFGASPENATRKQAGGISSAAVGMVVALAGGLYADTFLKRSVHFQQIRFVSYYLGFALIALGITTIINAAYDANSHSRILARLPFSSLVVWISFLGPLVLAVVYLADSRTFVLNPAGLQIQLKVYWLPMLTTTGVGAAMLFSGAIGFKQRDAAKIQLWIGIFAALVCFGLLRESLILPDLGDPLLNMLVAFVPFVLGSFCLCFGARSLLGTTSWANGRNVPSVNL